MKVYKRASDQCTRRKLRSPGHPPGWQRDNLCRFWQAIASGRASEDAAADAGVSAPVGVRHTATRIRAGEQGSATTGLALSLAPP